MDWSVLDPIGGTRTVIAVVIALAAIVILRKVFSAPRETRYAVPGQCASCGWTGSVSKFRAVCPRCGNKMGGR